MSNIDLAPRVQSSALSDKGRRPNNEDFVTRFEPTDLKERQASGCIYIVADGVGGASVGERASKYAAEKVLYEYLRYPEIEPATRIKQAINRANQEIFDYAEEKGIRMATTMTIAIVIGNSLIAANVGDSRVYLIRGNDVQQVTRDHNIVGELVRDGVLTEAEALKSKAKNKLTRSVGGQDEVHVDVFDPIPLQPADKILLCSDGLTRYALKDDIGKVAAKSSAEQITKDAVAFAKSRGRGGADNISVITVIYEPAGQLGPIDTQQARPVEPEEPWEIRETVIGIEPKKRKNLIKWLVIFTLLLGLTGVGSITFYLYENSTLHRSSTLSEATTDANVMSPVFSSTPPPSTSLPSLAPAAIFTLTDQPVLIETLSFSQEPTFTQTVTLTPQPSTTPSSNIVNCVYSVLSGDTLFDIAVRFEIGGSNWRKIFCVDDANNLRCDVSDPGSIQQGWQVVIPGVNESVCIQNGGQPQQQ